MAACAVAAALPTAATAATAPALPPGGTFVDDDTSIHQGWIEAIAAAGITKGCNPPDSDRFCPDAPVTRGQMAALLARALPLQAAPTPSGFTDIAVSPFAADITTIAAAGITKGCNPPSNDRYCPTAPVTRAQMAAFLQRGFGFAPAAADRFGDDDGSIFEPAIDALAAAEVTTGCNPPANDRYCPTAPVTRAQMATFLGRALDLAPIAVPPRPDTIDVVARNEWGAAPPNGVFTNHTIDHITIHHAGSATGVVGPPQFLGWQAYHQSLGWPDVAYHFIVGRDGLVYEGRPFSAAGDTATDYDPTGHLLIVVEGDFNESTPTPGQLENVARLVAWGGQMFGVPVAEAKGHRDHASTTCPGDNLYASIDDGSLAERAQELLDAGGVQMDISE